MNRITVVGYGSLLSEASARQTAPNLTGFRIARVAGYKRIFNKVGIVFLQRDGVDPASRAIASCASRVDPAVAIDCALFEVDEAEFTAIYEREHRFRWVEVEATSPAGSERGRMCTETTDADYRLNKCVTDSEYQRRVGRHYGGAIWRDDIEPYPPYLKHCLRAAQSRGDAVLANYLDTTFLADGTTTIRSHIAGHAGYRDWSDGTHAYPSG